MSIYKGTVVNWTNTTSASANSRAVDLAPWYDQGNWTTSNYPNISMFAGRYYKYPIWDSDLRLAPDTPIAISATQVTSDQAGSQSWPLWMFYVVAGTLTFGSIILPLVAGHVYRSTARLAVRRRKVFRATVSAIWGLYVRLSTFQITILISMADS
jgi:hypothetical protein